MLSLHGCCILKVDVPYSAYQELLVVSESQAAEVGPCSKVNVLSVPLMHRRRVC